jgi:hypothetical protein
MRYTACFPSWRRLLAAFAAGAFLATPAFAEESSWWHRVAGPLTKGSGTTASEVRNISGFQAIELDGSMKLVVRQAAKESVELRGDDNLLSLIETTVVDHDGVPTLQIGTKRDANFSTRGPMVVTVDVVQLKSIAVSGSGDAVAEGVKAADLQLSVSGSGDLRLRRLSADAVAVKVSGSGDVGVSGRAGKLHVSIAGSGDVSTRELEADDVSVNIAGSGDAMVNARKTLAVSIAGSGDVVYVGDASVKSSIAGSGSVKKR